ncbi:hypothetical protein FKM82_028799 [Ascaphus truei]
MQRFYAVGVSVSIGESSGQYKPGFPAAHCYQERTRDLGDPGKEPGPFLCTSQTCHRHQVWQETLSLTHTDSTCISMYVSWVTMWASYV